MRRYATDEEKELVIDELVEEGKYEEILENIEDYTTINLTGIDYRPYLIDYSEKSYLIKWREYEDSNLIAKDYVPKSAVDENGNIATWWLDKSIRKFPVFYTSGQNTLKLENEINYLKRLTSKEVDEKKLAKRKRNVVEAVLDIEEIMEELNAQKASNKSRLIKVKEI